MGSVDRLPCRRQATCLSKQGRTRLRWALAVGAVGWLLCLAQPAVAISPKEPLEAFFTHIVVHELMHGLGPHNISAGARQTTVRQELSNYYSYDDGSAEWGYSLNQSGGRIAYRFDTQGDDTLRAVRFSRDPWQSGQGCDPRYFASSSRTGSESVSL